MISFECSKADCKLIAEIVKRADWLAQKNGKEIDPLEMNMDITAAHCNGCPLDLQKLLGASTLDFVHDVYGIRNHIDRTTGELLDCFVPRCCCSSEDRRYGCGCL